MQANKVYFGGARRENFDAILDFPRKAKVYFAWKTGAWIEGVLRDDFIGLYTYSEHLRAVVASRSVSGGEAGKWKLIKHSPFNPHKEIDRAAGGHKAMGLPVDVALAYCDACARMVEAEHLWNVGLPEAEQAISGEGEVDPYGIQTSVGSN